MRPVHLGAVLAPAADAFDQQLDDLSSHRVTWLVHAGQAGTGAPGEHVEAAADAGIPARAAASAATP